jgi:hypothetical protein
LGTELLSLGQGLLQILTVRMILRRAFYYLLSNSNALHVNWTLFRMVNSLWLYTVSHANC